MTNFKFYLKNKTKNHATQCQIIIKMLLTYCPKKLFVIKRATWVKK
jgi:hypothetical protein